MTNKSLAYMVIAVAVGYLLIGAFPQQVSMYATPQPILSSGERATAEDAESFALNESQVYVAPASNTSDAVTTAEAASEAKASAAQTSSENGAEFEVRSMPLNENAKLVKMVNWWIVDLVIAFTVFWVAKRRF